jgi:zinc D-Ala-D-Ala carboxypeptidase
LTKSLFILAFLTLGLFPLNSNEVWTIRKDDLIGLNKPERELTFTRLKSPYTGREDSYLRKEVAKAFMEMADAANKDGFRLSVLSATRNFKYQKGIWERKWKAAKGTDTEKALYILQYSSMPGTSRHHWGTDFDINSLEPSWWETAEGKKLYTWLKANAKRFGFFQPYDKENNERLSGYRDEKWHWSYFPLSNKMTLAYNFLVDYEDITGFEGSESATTVQIIEKYVNGIFPAQ